MAKLGTYQPVIDPVTQVVCLGPISIPYTKLTRQNSQWETGKHITTENGCRNGTKLTSVQELSTQFYTHRAILKTYLYQMRQPVSRLLGRTAETAGEQAVAASVERRCLQRDQDHEPVHRSPTLHWPHVRQHGPLETKWTREEPRRGQEVQQAAGAVVAMWKAKVMAAGLEWLCEGCA